jgi:hypothetical protein
MRGVSLNAAIPIWIPVAAFPGSGQ